MTPDEEAVFADTRMRREPRIMGTWLSVMGEGWHEVSRDTWRKVLGASADGMAAPDSVGAYIRELVVNGWVERKAGGRGHSDLFRFKPPSEGGPNRTISSPLREALSLGATPGSPLVNDRDDPRSSLSPPLVVVEDVVVGVGDARVRRGQGSYQIEEEVEAVVEEHFEGARDSVRDYLRARVMGPHQYGWVRTMQTWCDGGTGSPKGLAEMDRPEQLRLVALACNELLGEDETRIKASRGQIGATGTMRSKMEYLIRRERATGRKGSLPGPQGNTRDQHIR